MRLKKLLLLLSLLAAVAELSARNAQRTGARALRGRHPKGGAIIQLCGREFVRAVIFICGGSRWKRLSESRGAEEAPLLGDGASAEFLQSNNDKGMKAIKLQSVPELEQLQHIGQPIEQQPLKHLTSDDLSEYILQIENAVQQGRGRPGLAKLKKTNNFPWINFLRRKRDYSMEVAEMCCNPGCTKTDIERLC